MLAELLALGAALCYASAHIVAKLATQKGNMLVGLVISLATGTVTLGAVAVLTVDRWDIALAPATLFALAGVAGSGVGRSLTIRAVRDAGTSVAVPVQSSANPLLAGAAGWLLFGETISLARVMALALIVSGIWACARGGSANQGEQLSLHNSRRRSTIRFLLLLWPLSAGAAFATADIFRKFALARHGDPILGAFIGMMASLVLWLLFLLLTIPHSRRAMQSLPSLTWFCLHGCITAAALIFLLFALQIGDLSVVAPIVASQTVIVILLGALILRNLERLRTGTIAGAVMVFLGVAYLSIT